jgi:ribosomal protein S18 acetylase RimI-like enzyme
MSEVLVRMCTKDDVSDLVPLISQLGYPTSFQELISRVLTYQSNQYGIAVACLHDKIVGWIAWSVSLIFVTNAKRFHIEGLIVDEHYRGLGIGKQLMLFVEKIAVNSAPSVIDLVSGVRRAKDGTHAFYENLGYHNQGPLAKLYFRKEIK